jgi:iron complex transport system ATP-binding protein
VSGAVLALESCSFSYGKGEFGLVGVSLAVRPGEMLGIIGPNGSGKSTLLRLMSGFLRPHAGRVLLSGSELGRIPRRALARRVAFLPQTPSPSFCFTSREVAAMGRYPYQGAFGLLRREDQVAIRRAMQETWTWHLADRPFATLSGGERQRVLIASVLAQEPEVMLLDEPTSALDIHHQWEVLELLAGLARAGRAVVTVMHDLNAAGQFCDRLALVSAGRVVRVGAAPEVVQEDVLAEAYGADVRVVDNPVTSQPMVVVVGRRVG